MATGEIGPDWFRADYRRALKGRDGAQIAWRRGFDALLAEGERVLVGEVNQDDSLRASRAVSALSVGLQTSTLEHGVAVDLPVARTAQLATQLFDRSATAVSPEASAHLLRAGAQLNAQLALCLSSSYIPWISQPLEALVGTLSSLPSPSTLRTDLTTSFAVAIEACPAAATMDQGSRLSTKVWTSLLEDARLLRRPLPGPSDERAVKSMALENPVCTSDIRLARRALKSMQRLVEATLSQFPSSRLRRDITDCLVGLLHELAAVDGARGVRRTVLDAATRHLGFRRQAVRTVTALVTFGGATLGYSEQLFFSLSRLRLDQDAETRRLVERAFAVLHQACHPSLPPLLLPAVQQLASSETLDVATPVDTHPNLEAADPGPRPAPPSLPTTTTATAPPPACLEDTVPRRTSPPPARAAATQAEPTPVETTPAPLASAAPVATAPSLLFTTEVTAAPQTSLRDVASLRADASDSDDEHMPAIDFGSDDGDEEDEQMQ